MDPFVLQGIMEDAGYFDFLKKEAHAMVEELAEELSFAGQVMSEAAWADLETCFFKRRLFLYGNSLYCELENELRRQGHPASLLVRGTNKEAIARAGAALAMDAALASKLREKAPLLPEQDRRITSNLRRAVQLFLQRLMKERERISDRLLGGKSFRCILRLRLDDGDSHRHGQAVIGVESDGGTFYYKPHDCGLDAFYEDLVTAWFADSLVAARVVSGEGYAFVSELRHEELPQKEAAGLYFRNLGVLLALLHGLGSRDMHQENVMSVGVYPAVLDLETLLNPEKCDISPDKLAYELRLSLWGTGGLPSRQHKMGFFSLFHVSTLSGKGSSNSLPLFEGKLVEIFGYEEALLQGFHEGYRRMLSCRDSIEPLLLRHKDSVVRYVKYNTSYYYLLRRELYKAEALSSPEKWERALDKVSIPARKHEINDDENSIRYEKKCLIEGDIPYYCVPVDSRHLCGEHVGDIVQENYFEKSPLEHMRDKLAHLSEPEALLEEDILRSCFRHVPKDVVSVAEPFPLPEEPSGPEEMRRLAMGIWQELLQERIRRTDGLISWQGWALQLLSFLPQGLQLPWCETARYIAGMPQPHSSEMREVLGSCLEGLRRWVFELERNEDARKLLKDVGLYSGCGAFMAACLEVAEKGLADVQDLLQGFLPFLRSDAIPAATKTGVGYGLAGLVLPLSGLLKAGIDPGGETGDALKAAAEALTAKAWSREAGGEEGLASVAAALSAAYACSGRTEFAQAANAALTKVREAYRKDLGGWTRADERLPWLATRAPWSADIAWHMMDAMGYLDGREGESLAREIFSLAIESLRQEDKLLWRDSIYEGNAFSVLALERAGALTENPGDRKLAARILSAMQARREKEGSFQVTPKGIQSFFDYSFNAGTLGIGYAASFCLAADKGCGCL